jgi:MFS family permease
MIALPLTAVVLLHASPTQMGLLTAAELLPFMLLSLPSGVLLDRMHKLPVYMTGEILLSMLTLTVPVVWAMGWLNMYWLYLVGVGAGCVYTVAGSAAQIVMSQVAGREHLVTAHSQSALANSVAEIGGPASAGLLIKALGAPLTLLVDALLLLGSVLMLRGIRIHETISTQKTARFMPQLLAGLAFVRGQRTLRQLAWVMGSWQFFAHMALSVQVIYAIRGLGLDEKTLALSYVALGLGSVAGGLFGPWLGRRMGLGNTLLTGFFIGGTGWMLLATGASLLNAEWRFALMLWLYAMGGTLLFINFLSIRQSVTPTDLLGRMTSTMRWLTLLPAGPVTVISCWVRLILGCRLSRISLM